MYRHSYRKGISRTCRGNEGHIQISSINISFIEHSSLSLMLRYIIIIDIILTLADHNNYYVPDMWLG